MPNEKLNRRPATPQTARSAAEVQQWMISQLAEELKIDREKIKVDQPILSFGIDSMQIVVVVAKLEDWLGFRFPSNPLEDYSTIEELSQYVADMSGK
ncbi:MAG: acyl carrier protein [Pirellulaceae bacterium]|jgi:acyl carrier protein|nr:acyl carrier protein [Pirellulaceae bacterium]